MEKMPKTTKIFRLSDIQGIYLAITAIFLLTGFIYNYLYFRFFNIEVERYFTVQDYLASSLEKIYIIIIAIPFAFLSSYIARYFVLEKQKLLHHRILTTIITCVPVFTFVMGAILVHQYRQPLGYYLLSFAVFAGCDYMLYRIIFKGDRGSYRLYFYFNTFIFYLLIIVSTAVYERDSALYGPLRSFKKNRVHFTRNFDINQNACIILESNDNFFFFYDKELNKTYIVPKDGISYIETYR